MLTSIERRISQTLRPPLAALKRTAAGRWIGRARRYLERLAGLGSAHCAGNSVVPDQRLLDLAEQYELLMQRSERGHRDPAYRPAQLPSFDPLQSQVKLIAYYLPQFHPIPENDAWWGRGFTEWTNVTRAVPQFVGHYQPQLPSDMGFYDLRNEETLEQQVALAKSYGISGFCIYHYWFNGHRLLERPLDILYRRKDLDFPFCLCWANENWTRRWDGAEEDVLLAQAHSPDSDRQFIEDALRYMDDPRYIELDGRPVLVVYRAMLLPEPQATAERWRKLARERLGKDLFLISVVGFDPTPPPETIGFDAAVQFPPHNIPTTNITQSVRPLSSDYNGQVYSYPAICGQVREHLDKFEFPVIPAVFPGWDNTARRGKAGFCFHGSDPEPYSSWLSEAALHAVDKPVGGSSMVFINAWNEWAEGAHLEPDQKYGHAFLRATAEVLRPYATASGPREVALAPTMVLAPQNPEPTSRTAVVIHAFYPDVLTELLQKLPKPANYDVFISVVDDTAAQVLPIIEQYVDNPRVYQFPNRGRDIRPFLFMLRNLTRLGYKHFIKLHTKKTVHRTDGSDWHNGLIGPLLELCRGDHLARFFDAHPRAGMLGPAGHLLDGRNYMGSAGNIAWLRCLCRDFNITPMPSSFTFVGGTMFAGRVASFARLAERDVLDGMFEEDLGRVDGTLAHALERFIGLLMTAQGEVIGSAALIDNRLEIEAKARALDINYKFAGVQPASPRLLHGKDMSSPASKQVVRT